MFVLVLITETAVYWCWSMFYVNTQVLTRIGGCLGWTMYHSYKSPSSECVCVRVTDRFELDPSSDLVQKSIPAGAGHGPLTLLHLFQLGSLPDLAQQCRLPAAIPSVSLRGGWRCGGRRAGWRWRRWWGRRRCAAAGWN